MRYDVRASICGENVMRETIQTTESVGAEIAFYQIGETVRRVSEFADDTPWAVIIEKNNKDKIEFYNRFDGSIVTSVNGAVKGNRMWDSFLNLWLM